jgi:hypothetical protein
MAGESLDFDANSNSMSIRTHGRPRTQQMSRVADRSFSNEPKVNLNVSESV